LVLRTSEIIEREFGRNNPIWLNGLSYYYNANHFHPSFRRAIVRIEEEVWNLLKAFGYSVKSHSRFQINLGSNPPQLPIEVWQPMVEYTRRSDALCATRSTLSKLHTRKVQLEAEILVKAHLR
jgi:hypothetical protein